MGWWGVNPWDGDSPADILCSLDDHRATCVARLLGVPPPPAWVWRRTEKHKKAQRVLDRYAAEWVKQWNFGAKPKRSKDGTIILTDPFDLWSLVGVVCKLLNAEVALQRGVVQWASDACEIIGADAEFCGSWRQPLVFRRSVRSVKFQLMDLLNKSESSFLFGTIESVVNKPLPRNKAQRGTKRKLGLVKKKTVKKEKSNGR